MEERYAPKYDSEKLKGKIELTWPSKDYAFWDIDGKDPIWHKEDEIPNRIIRFKEFVGEPNCNYDELSKKWIKTDKPQKFNNMIIKGDNLLALKALEDEFTGKIKLIYIDPPYNTGNAFEHYDDNIQHSIWLSLLKSGLELFRKLLNKNGVLFVQLDETEMPYCKVLLDNIFGRKNCVSIITWERGQRTLLGQGESYINDTNEYILIYAKDKTQPDLLNKMKKEYPIEEQTYKQYNKLIKKIGKKTLFEEFEDNFGNKVKIYKTRWL